MSTDETTVECVDDRDEYSTKCAWVHAHDQVSSETIGPSPTGAKATARTVQNVLAPPSENDMFEPQLPREGPDSREYVFRLKSGLDTIAEASHSACSEREMCESRDVGSADVITGRVGCPPNRDGVHQNVSEGTTVSSSPDHQRWFLSNVFGIWLMAVAVCISPSLAVTALLLPPSHMVMTGHMLYTMYVPCLPPNPPPLITPNLSS